MKAPNSYFTTAFSGSVRVQRARLKNLFAKDRRPGVLPLTIVVLCAALLGGLVSCQPTVSDEPKVPTAIPTAIVWGEQVQSTVLTAENMADPNVEVPDGVAVRLRFTMPYIENAAGHEALEALNRDFLSQGQAWLEKGREYWGTPGLVPGGDYSVEGTHTVTRCDDLISVRYDRVERLPYPTATRTAVTYSLAGGTARELRLDDLFDGDAEDWTPILLDEAVRANADFDRDYYESYFDVNAFYLTGDLLVLLFPVWEDGAPIPCSTAECSIPLTSLADISSELLRPRALITPAPPVATGTPAFSIAVPDALLDNVPPVALRAAQEQCLPGGAYYESFAASTDRRASPIFDRAELLFLREDWTYDRLDAVPNTDPAAIKIYSFGARFHTTTPDRVSPAGSPKLTDNGWYTPSCEGAHRLIFEERDGVLTYKTYLMVNDSSPGDPLFTDDLLRALYPEDFYRSSPSSAAYCVEVARPQTEVIKLTAFSQAARLNGVVPDGGNVEVWYLAWQDHLGDIGLVSSTYYTYCFFFMDADGALLHAQAAQVTGDDLYDDAQALWDAYTAS